MIFRYFDCNGRQISYEELQSLNICTPIMEHVVATVIQRVKKAESEEVTPSKSGRRIDKRHNDMVR